EGFRRARTVPSPLVGRSGKPVARKRGTNNMKRIPRIAAVRGWVGERPDQLHELDDRPRPAVGDDERKRIGLRRADMQKVNVRAVDSGGELRKLVQTRFVFAPVV